MVDPGIAQTPMFGDGAPDGWALFLPGYRAGRVAVEPAFSASFHAAVELALAALWGVASLAVVAAVLSRWIGVDRRAAQRGSASVLTT